jgi:GT2 family glycosyltransferase
VTGQLTVSVIVCTRERPQLLHDTIESILAGETKPTEIIIVDQSGRADPELEHHAEEGLRYLWTRGRGLTRARNLGITSARGQIIAFSDDDVRVHTGWLSALVDAIGEEDERRVAAGQVIPGSPERRGAFTTSSYVDSVPATYTGRIERDPLGGGNMAMYRSGFDLVGLFDERLGPGTRYPAAEDNDFGLRLLEAGFCIVYAPEAIVYHRAWRSRWWYPLVRWRYGRGKGGFYGKHLGLSDRHIQRRLARDVGHRARRLPRNMLRQPRQAVGDLAYLAGLATALMQWLVKERRE